MTQPSSVVVPAAVFPDCPHCGRKFLPGSAWKAANFCRAAFLLPYIAEHPGLSAAELSQATGLPYGLATGGLQKAREHGVVEFTPEERGVVGGVRYRYAAAPGWQTTVKQWE